ncbi:hypothetical protein [Janthinobacterium sp. BJB304]|uniref:hypothetical protein n=1 Tax=Janthinobacterium sp. BJB304 TaxID=1572871 RepID=UPI000C0C9808|nr:hypothetical protein [Janthinobacterium sp. BJB304]PHV39219.1 hypothetical protein CSQ95_10930 [Janthinobacterium sp. BJB304]
MNVLPIKAAPLVLHAGGARSHPELPFFDDGDAESWNNWLRVHRLEVMRVWMEDDTGAEDSYRKFLAGGSAEELSAWQPCKPDGDRTWILLAVFDGREGPCAYFVRRAAYFLKAQIPK